MRNMILRGFFIFYAFVFLQYSHAQLVTIVPADATGDDELTIIFDASEGTGALTGASSVYMHSGVVVSGPEGTDWQYVVGNWGQDDGVGEMTPVEGEADKWQITLTPREYYSVPEGENIFRLAMVFRDATGANEAKGTPGAYDWGFVASNGDIYVDLEVDAYVNILTPQQEMVFIEHGGSFLIEAEASAEVTEMTLLVNEEEKASVSSGTSIAYSYSPAESEEIAITVEAVISGVSVETSRSVNIQFRSAVVEAQLPQGVVKGINYHDDETSVTLVLEAPGKEFVYVVGDFTEWKINDNYLMNKIPDGELFWLKVSGLTPGEPYVFQYWVEGTIKVGDPYAAQVADPWNDPYISEEVYSNLPVYNKTENGIATVLQTAQEPYNWAETESSWIPPRKDELVIYELLIRDFLGSHSYQDLKDTLSYLKRLGVNAIELMPIMEFEGNSSWGYNPSYFFAPDKYYGTKEDLKKFIETAHQQGFAVILDMVLNHAFGQNAMVQMYWDESNGTVSEDNPWFNPVATHPFNVGFDFNHESSYTKSFADSVNRYWLEEFHFDGYRFDLSKGFTQTNYGDDVNAWSQYDQGRIDLLRRMAGKIWSYDPDAYVILEHFAAADEEAALAAEGMLLWRGLTHSYAEALKGNGANLAGANAKTHVSFMESHDEQRLAYEMKVNGGADQNYNTRDKLVALERLKMAAAFHFLQAGPKMLWQFGELGYDIDINYIDRLAEKPLPWGDESLNYYDDKFHQYLYEAYSAILALRNDYPLVIRTGSFSGSLNEPLKYFSITHPTLNITVVGNFGLEEAGVESVFPFPGTWYDYFSGEETNVTNTNDEIFLQPGEFHIYTSERVSEGFPDVVQVYENPVTVEPAVFTLADEITIVFDATKAEAEGTSGLVGAEKVYMHAGIVTEGPDGTKLEKEVGSFTDDGVGEMSRVSGEANKWTLTFSPKEYFAIADDVPVYRIGMYFRDANNENLGKGFRGELIYLDVQQEGSLVTIEPADFSVSDEITITFDAAMGNRGLMKADKVYMHSGVVTTEVETPTGDDWSHVVGTWGADDGVGEMTRVEGTNKWQITLTPSEYYDLSGDAYWLTMVFRNASGAAKGTGTGELDGGYIADNGDIYMLIPSRKRATGMHDFDSMLRVFPNPASDQLFIEQVEDVSSTYALYTVSGKLVVQSKPGDAVLNVSACENGIYLLVATMPDRTLTTRIIIKK